jgi:4-carboxymuconolactone decarboxylase
MRAAAFLRVLNTVDPDEHAAPRLIGLLSAAIAVGDAVVLAETVGVARSFQFTRSHAYEIVLQSYLFLGFPRMLEAADVFHREWPGEVLPTAEWELSAEEANHWMSRGRTLCRQVYGDLYEPLKRKVESLAPEIFRWMVLEGYGKVLARPEFDFALRELSIIAFLIVDNRPRQLHSHLRGALNCGTPPAFIRLVIDDLEIVAPDGYRAARAISLKLGIEL